MLSTLRKLSSRTSVISSKPHMDQSIFAYARKASAELSNIPSPHDLDSLSRVVASINSFQYPPFESTLREMFSRGGDLAWKTKLYEESKVCKGADALRYLKSLSCCNLPVEIVENLLNKVRIESAKDISEFLSVVVELQSVQRSKSVFIATNAVVQKAIQAKLGLSVYTSIFETISKDSTLVASRTMSELCQTGWKTMFREWKDNETTLVDAIKWICLGHADKTALRGIDPSAMSTFITQLETRVRTTDFAPSNVFTIILSILRINKQVIPEPLDSISQLLSSKFPKTLTTSQLIALVEAVNQYTLSPTRSVQLEAVVDALLPIVLSETRRSISAIPAQHLPGCLELLGRVDSDAVEEELVSRGFEMDPVAVARLFISFPSESVSTLFADSQDTDFVNRLSTEERLQFLSLVGSDSNIGQAIAETLRDIDVTKLSTSCLVRMAACGDSVYASTNLVPSVLVAERFATDSLSNEQALALLERGVMREAMISFLLRNSHTLNVYEGIQLLKHSEGKVLKHIVPTIDAMDTAELMDVLRSLPVVKASAATWAPETQLNKVVMDRFAVLTASVALTIPQVVEGLVSLSRMNCFELEPMTKVIARLEQYAGPRLTASVVESISLAKALSKLGIYSRNLVDIISLEAMPCSPEQLCELADAWMHLGVRNDGVVAAIDQTLRLADQALSTRIALLNVLSSQGIFSPLFQEELRRVMAEAIENVSLVRDEDWTKLFQINLNIVIDAPPKIKVKYANNALYKAFVDDHCAFAWYAKQEQARSRFIHSTAREQLVEAMTSLGWTGSVPEAGKEVYHIDILMGQNRAIVFIPASDELAMHSGGVRIIVGDSLAKLRHLQMFGYKVVPVWAKEWDMLETLEQRKECLLKNSLQQVVYSLGPNMH